MLKVGLLCGVIAAMSVTGINALHPSQIESKSCDTRFIVELKDDVDSLTKDQITSEQNKVVKEIKSKINANSQKTISYSVLNNAFVITGNKEDYDAISKLSNVKSVTEDVEHVVTKSLDAQPVSFRVDSGDNGNFPNRSAQTMEKPETGTGEGEGSLIAILDNEFYFRAKTSTSEAYYHEVYTDLPTSVKLKLNATKLSKTTGLHAPVKKTVTQGREGSCYFNRKVPFYYDYAGDSTTGSTGGVAVDRYTGYPIGDYNVASEIGLHGSHVSSIAAANAPTYKGIAPNAQLACMKVFSDVESTPASEEAGQGKYSSFSESGFLCALEDAVTLGADVINVSIGSDLDDFSMDSITMRTLSKLTVVDGVLTSISAGNGGKSSYSFTGAYGNWTRDMVETGVLGSFANNKDTMSIAAGQPDYIFYENAFVIGDDNVAYEDQIVYREGGDSEFKKDQEIKMVSLRETYGNEIEWAFVNGFGTANDFEKADVEGKVAFVMRGSINFLDKYRNAVDAGAIGLCIINNDPTANDFNFRCSFNDELTNPTIPCALVLFKDKPLVEGKSGSFTFLFKQESENKLARTISDYSSDGARFDLDLKPEITTPGSNIRGAVWPQTKEEKETPYAAYEYFNGTSMAAPNYAGAVAVLMSKISKDAVSDGNISAAEEAQLKAFRKTVNMRFMSTATQMIDNEANGEDNKKTITSPRLQGAGMANIEGAYNTDVYLEGKDTDGTALNKSKILLRNNADIAKGNVKLSFVAHNESNASHSYDVKFNVMRPASVDEATIVTSDYNYLGEVDTISLIPGIVSYDVNGLVESSGTASYKDAIKVSKDIEYYTSQQDAINQTNVQVLKQGFYYVSSDIQDSATGIVWSPLPAHKYQSVKDVEIATVNAGTITVASGDNEISLDSYSLTKEAKDKIAELYEYGTYIEGYVTMTAKENGVPSLSIPYLGFYSLSDRDETMSYDSAPVVEPFSFEKNVGQVYASDLVLDVTKQLLGKDKANFGSIWLAGYADTLDTIDTDKILTNDISFTDIQGFESVGTIPNVNGQQAEFAPDPTNNIYVGNAHATNTMIVQQFVMRSVLDNYFTITNKATGKEVYRDALSDLLFGDQYGKNVLFKSHVDANYLGAGYVAHRAYAAIPLYDPLTKKAFDSGEYEIKFNYQLAATKNWVSKTYTLHIDNETPTISSIINYDDNNVRIEFKDSKLAYAVVGSIKHEVSYDNEKNCYFVTVTKDLIKGEMNKLGQTNYSKKRLFIQAVDYARGSTGAIVHFENNDNLSKYNIVQATGITSSYDFEYENNELKVYSIDKFGRGTLVTLKDNAVVVVGEVTHLTEGGCGGSIIASSFIVTLTLITCTCALILKKRKLIKGGNK